MTSRMAVLVDGDNVGGKFAGEILAIAAQHGIPTMVRVYLDAQRASDWHGVTGYRMIHAGSGKNASDVLLSIDAVEMALSMSIENFAIVSSDRDFGHVAQRLREYGATVTGIGEAKTPAAFRDSCHSFIVLTKLPNPSLVDTTMTPISELDRQIRALIAENSKKGAGIPIASLGPAMHSRHGTRISAHPDRTWRAYLLARPQLYDLDPRGPSAHVRFRPAGFSEAA